MTLQVANDNRAPITPPVAIARFEVGETYSCRSLCDWDCIYRFEVMKRTEKTVTISYHGKLTRRTIRIADGSEQIDPHGRYSMSPTLRAKPYS